jgi:hypothetical protein
MIGIRVSCKSELKQWGKFGTDKIKQILICGDPHLDKKWKFVDDRILYLRCRDGWEHLPEKMFCAYNAIVQMPEFADHTHFLKLDRDSDITGKFSAHRSRLIKQKDYVGQSLHTPHRTRGGIYHLGRVSKDSPWHNKRYRKFRNVKSYQCKFALGGASYILSRNAIEKIREFYTADNYLQIEKDHIYEDLMIGMLLKISGIHPHQMRYGVTPGGRPYKGALRVLKKNPQIWRT